MQNIAGKAGCVDKGFSAWYNGTIKSKRLQKRTAPAREAVDLQDADTGSKMKII